MQSFKDVSNLILEQLGLSSAKVKNTNEFIPILQQTVDDRDFNFAKIINSVKNRDKESVFKYLSDQGVSVLFEASSQSRDSLMHWACLSGDLDILKMFKNIYDESEDEKLLSWIEVINMKNFLEQTPLHWCCTIENLSLIEFLKIEGADLNVADNKGVTPLIMCSQYGNTSCATYLVLNGVNIFLCDKEGDNALHWALYKGNPELSRLMIYSGLNPNQKDGFGQTPLHFACLSGNANCVQNLVEIDKVDINVFDNNNKTPLMLAAGRRQTKIVNYLKLNIKCRAFKQSTCSKIKSQVLGTPFNSYIPLIFFLSSSMLWGNPYYFLVIRPYSINYAYCSNIFFLVMQSLMWICFAMASRKDPGFIARNDSRYVQMMNEVKVLENFKNIRIKDCFSPINKICHSCKSYKPIRSRHCKTCDRCVDEMDHHCPYVGNCIGKRNRFWFLLFIIFLNVALITVSYLFFLASYSQGLTFYLAAITWVLIIIGIFLGLTILIFMTKQAMSNLTLIETQKWKRYNYLQDENGCFRNPYDKGYLNNLLLFFNVKMSDVLQ